MFKRNAISAASLICLSALALPTFAQQQLERVEVTGSRILSVNAESAAPIQVMTAADIKASGVTNLQDLLLKNPTFGTPTISRTNSNFSTSSAGVSTIDLRNLGVDRTLVLVNGRRYVSGVPGSMAVDLNTIPTDFIERVEVMTGGASSTYGSDAVAGVVNIILKRNFEGVNLDASVGRSSKNDDTLKKFSASFGTNSADGKGNVMAHFAVSKQGAVYSRDREASAVDQISVGGGLTGDASQIFDVQRPFYSSFAPQGRFFYGPLQANGTYASRTFDANGNVIPFSTNGPAGDGVGATGFNRSAFRTIAIPTDRVLMATKGDYALNESHTVFFEGTYANTKTFTHLEPYPMDSSVSITPGGTSFIPAETLVNGVKVKNPLIPQALFARMTDRDGDGLVDYNFTRRMSDVADRTSSANRDTFRVVGGLKGDLAKNWSYDSYLGYGYTREGQTGTGQVNVLNFLNALKVINDPVTGAPICADAVARRQGCAPANIFGANTLSAAAAQYINAPSSLNTAVTQKMAGASVSGEAFDLPAGAVGLAAGFEWRQESSSTNFDALTQVGLNAGNALANTAGSYMVREAFVEAKLPLLKNLPAVKSLDGTLAYRHGDYSSVGGTNSWNTGLDWAMNSTFRVRATKAVSTRAPNVGDLYQGPSQTFPTSIVDPCVGVKTTDTSAKGVNCMADAGVRANQAAHMVNGVGTFTLGQADVQGISGYDRGNPLLKPEQGKSTTLGIVFTPKDIAALRNFTFTADYYDIKIARAINAPGRNYTLDKCYNGGDQTFCKFITRRANVNGAYSAGSIDLINQIPENSGGQRARGIDFTSSFAERLGPGTVSAKLTWTHLLEAWTKPTADAEKDSSLGEVGNSRNRWTLNLGYSSGPWAVNTTTTFIGKAYLDDQFMNSLCNFAADDVDQENCLPVRKEQGKIASKVYFDLQGSYKYQKAEFYVGVNNLFNTKAPPIISGLPGDTTGAETDAGTYDAIGRRYYVGIRYNF